MATEPDLVAGARRLSPEIFAARETTERLGQISQSLANSLASAGLYQMYLPRCLGGPEPPPLTVFEAIEQISSADGSVGWCLMNANAIILAAGWLKPEVGRQMFGQQPDVRVAGSLRPQGEAEQVEGGYRVCGRWNFASGVRNANWLFCPCRVAGSQSRASGMLTPTMRTMWVPVEAATIVDAWSVMGMRGTGSHDFVINDLFVPEQHSISIAGPSQNAGPLYRPRCFLALAHLLFAANALGIARGAIDALIAMASEKSTTLSLDLLRDRPAVQARLAQAEAIVSAARCFVVDALAGFWTVLSADRDDPGRALARLRLAIPHAVHEAVRAVDLVFQAAGTNAIYTANPLERQLRDIHVAAQHAAAFPIHFESAGKVLLGLQPAEPGW